MEVRENSVIKSQFFRTMLAYFLILLGAVLRVVPHPANFAPIAALALFGGANLNKKYALVVPLAAMLVSDYFIGFDSITTRFTIYATFLLSGLIGIWLKNHKNVYTITGGALVSSTLFFLITNLPAIHQNGLYPNTWAGTMTSYINGLPFFTNTLLGDLFYTAVFFGVYELARAYQSKRELAYAHQSKSSS